MPESITPERIALGLYAVAARDVTDFIDMVREEQSIDVLKILNEMLVTSNPNMSKDNKELNALVAPFVQRELEKRR